MNEQSNFITKLLDSEQQPKLPEDTLLQLSDQDLFQLRAELNEPLKLQQSISPEQEALLKRKLSVVLAYNDNLPDTHCVA